MPSNRRLVPELIREVAGIAFALILGGLAFVVVTNARARDNRVVGAFLGSVAVATFIWVISRHVNAAAGALLQDVSVVMLVSACGLWLYWKSRRNVAENPNG